ncbi:LysR family transcriptional regulator [Limosilactobacillus sp. STM2_1]|uniref:LysR family transcriptional regulator n=1 Tax=Limosilactobacillus rudii TaxID=2759755 RepID=A0A7W3UKH7_9LACO|nr:LysR family transcriptional regulator [Limosilactobacillus rudii]MBB1079214.1 LysR family transcriptional regulator [Limosilactobacillus rudii]MBB1097303.1 LysR family transcriptional regulator [Limosilactobacillus rudii]MCD7134412.1 LysR family transcriptional regulator [Limosilactobacillus rudii]
MYDQVLDTFIAVVREGSFSKAASSLFMSAVSVMKQMNNFESDLGFKIFNRSPRGISLTPAGKALYSSAQQIIRDSREAISAAQAIAEKGQTTIRIATSMLRSARPLMEAWERMGKQQKDYQLQIIPFNDDAATLRQITNQLGKTVDLLVGPTNANYLMDNEFDFFNLGDQRCNIMVPRQNKLANKEKLNWDDLAEQKILLIRPGLSPKIDELRNEITQHHPEITIVNADYFYDIDTFNYCVHHNYLMEALEQWHNVHPSMVSIPMTWDYSISYGILSSSHANPQVKEFISLVGQEYLNQQTNQN